MLFNFLLSIASLKLGFHTFHISRSLFHLSEDDFYFLAWNPFRVSQSSCTWTEEAFTQWEMEIHNSISEPQVLFLRGGDTS